jgi:hypothetical protein
MPSFSQYCPHVSQCYSIAHVFKDGFKGLMIHSYLKIMRSNLCVQNKYGQVHMR